MQNGYSITREDEAIIAENKEMKMKLESEMGAKFNNDNPDLDPRLENAFLRHVIEFESKIGEAQAMKIREILGNPELRSVGEIPAEEIDEAWVKLLELMETKFISLSVCSPNVSSRELYRFATEEFMDLEIDHVSIDGMMTYFIYDEFYPDPVYECEKAAVECCIRLILCSRPIEYEYHFAEKIELNDTPDLDFKSFAKKVNAFKNQYAEIKLDSVTVNEFTPGEEKTILNGNYHIRIRVDEDWKHLNGNWEVELSKMKEMEFWVARKVSLEKLMF